MIGIFFVKLLDTMINTAKSIFLQKDKIFLAAIFTTISQYFFIVVTKKVVTTNDNYILGAVLLATFIGSYAGSVLTSKMIDKLSKQQVYIIEVTPIDYESGKAFSQLVASLGIGIKMSKDEIDDKIVITSKIFAETREETKEVLKIIPNGFKYNIIPAKRAETVGKDY